jgi:two-component system, OmpR family, alkaline phosphatase synthesis response regulator PhoP
MGMSIPKILVVDDEPSISNLVISYLRREGYEVQVAEDGLSALRAARAFQPDIVVLDIMLPGMDGLEVLTLLRRETNPYVILLTAKAEEIDRILGLSIGADDYVTKPFSPRELVARVKAALRRLQVNTERPSANTLNFKHIRIDPGSRQAWVAGELTDLTALEFDLLKTLAEHRGMVLSREQLLEKVWETSFFADLRVVDVHIGHLRQKMGEGAQFIVTVRGAGYRFDDEVG